jgi:hypothetical protein
VIIERGRVAAALPGYRLGAQLGTGAFGLVLAARHRRLKRDVAVKVVAAEAVKPGGEFAAEAELLAGLDHPHVVRVFDYLEADGLGLIVMELCGGGTLTRRRATLTPGQVCAVGLAVAAGIGHAHGRGILHRDIKMGNILFDAAGTVKVGDFGIARMFTGSGITGTVHGAGTPLYMAPEQITGGRLGPPTDLYALGLLLYQLFTGRPPFDPTLPAPQLWQQQLTALPPPLTGVPEPIGDVVLGALEKDPSARPPDAETFARELAAAAVTVHGPGWLAGTGLPLHLTDPVRHTAAPLLPALAPAPAAEGESAGAGAGAGAGAVERTVTALGAWDSASPLPRSTRAGRLRRAGRSRRRLGATAAALLLGVGTLLGVLLWPSPGSALAQRQAWSRQLAAASATTGDPALARRLAAAAYQTAPTPEASRQTLALLGAGNRPQATLTGHLDTVGALAFSPNGQLLATGSTDHTARLWDTTTRGTVRPLATLTGHLDTVEALAFSPNGQLLATGSDDHTARLWDVDPGRLVAAACATPAGRLTAPEWHRVLPHAPYQPPCG